MHCMNLKNCFFGKSKDINLDFEARKRVALIDHGPREVQMLVPTLVKKFLFLVETHFRICISIFSSLIKDT